MGLFGWEGAFKSCNTFRVWAEYPLGVQLFLFVLSYRLLLIHRLVVQGKEVTTLWKTLLILGVYVPLLGGYLALALTDQTAEFVQGVGCVAKLPWSIYSFSVVLLGLLVLVYLTFALRNIKKMFHEYRETRYGVIVSIGVYIIVSILYFMQLNYTFEGRVTILVLVGVLLNFYFWAVLFKPVYYCLFNKDKHLARFQVELGLEDEWAATYIISRGMAPPAEGPTGQQTLQVRRATWDRNASGSSLLL
jgi:heme/copper-type cytochrome/quinol oxidase subunit 4